MRFKIVSLVLLIILLCSIPVVLAEMAEERRVNLKDVLEAGNLKAWRGWLKDNKPIREEQNFTSLLSSKPDQLVVVPMEPDFALTTQEMVDTTPQQKFSLDGENILLVSYSFKYGEPLWWSAAFIYYFGRPSRPPDEFGLEMKLKVYLLNTSERSLVGYPELKLTGNTDNRDTKLNELFDTIKSGGTKALMFKRARDLVLLVGRVVDGEKVGIDENLRRNIARLEIKVPDARLRQRGAEVLVNTLKLDDIEILSDLLDDKDSDVRGAVVEELNKKLETAGIDKKFGPSLVPLFRKALLDNESYVREKAVEGLGKTRLPEVLELLLVAAKDEDDSVRRAAAESLGQVGNKKATESLILLLDDPNSGVYRAASKSLDKLGWKPPDITLRLKYFLASDNKVDDLIALGNQAVPFLIEALQSKDSGRIKKAADALGKIGDLRAVEPLLVILATTDVQIQVAAAEALGKIGNSQAVIPLIASLKESDNAIRIAAIKALAKISDNRAAEPISELLEDENKDVRKAASEALNELNWQPSSIEKKVNAMLAVGDADGIVKIGKPAVKPLVSRLADESDECRIEVIRILGLLGNNATLAVVPITASLLSKKEKEVIAAASALANIGDLTASEAIQKALDSRHKPDKVSLWLRYALARLGVQREDHFSCLIDTLSSEIGDTAVEVISQMDLQRGEVEIISKFLRNPDPNTRKRTAVILANAGDSTVLDRLWERLTEEDNAEVRKAIREAIRKAGVKKGK